MEVNKVLYKKDSKGKIRMLRISTDLGLLKQESGLKTGKIKAQTRIAKPKNVGRANETSSEEQAILEAESLIKKKLSEGYFETEQEAITTEVVLPMLAAHFGDVKDKIKYPCSIQPKLDGMRGLWHEKEFITRGGKDVKHLKHIENAIQDAPFTLDGELYAHGKSFQENMKIIKKYVKGETEKVKFHVYDLVSDEPFLNRYSKLTAYATGNPELEVVETYVCLSEEDVKTFHDDFVMQGYEGAIVRWDNTGYELNKRSNSLLKVKDFIDAVGIVVDVTPLDKEPEQGQFVCRLVPADNLDPNADLVNTFGNIMAFSHDERKEFLTNKDKYIGQEVEIRFFEYTDEGLPRHPRCLGLR